MSHEHMGHSGHQPAVVGDKEEPADMSPMMKMYFHLGYDVNIVIYGWDATTTATLVGTVIAVFLLAVGYEFIKFSRMFVVRDLARRSRAHSHSVAEETETMASTQHPDGNNIAIAISSPPNPNSYLNVRHVTRSLLYCLQVTVSFTLMLFVMTFNIWIFLAIILGLTVGHFLFAKNNLTCDVHDCCN